MGPVDSLKTRLLSIFKNIPEAENPRAFAGRGEKDQLVRGNSGSIIGKSSGGDDAVKIADSLTRRLRENAPVRERGTPGNDPVTQPKIAPATPVVSEVTSTAQAKKSEKVTSQPLAPVAISTGSTIMVAPGEASRPVDPNPPEPVVFRIAEEAPSTSNEAELFKVEPPLVLY